MAIRGKIVSLNLVNNKLTNQHLMDVAAALENKGVPHEELFFTQDEKVIRLLLQQRRVYLLYLVVHAERNGNIECAGKMMNVPGFVSLFSHQMPKYVFVNGCYGKENGLGTMLVRRGCRYSLVGEGYITLEHAFKYGKRFFEVLLKYNSASRAIYYIDRLRSAQYGRFKE